MDGRYVYIIIYKENFAQQYDKCVARSGSPQLLYIIIFHSYTLHIHVYNYSLSKVSILEEYVIVYTSKASYHIVP